MREDWDKDSHPIKSSGRAVTTDWLNYECKHPEWVQWTSAASSVITPESRRTSQRWRLAGRTCGASMMWCSNVNMEPSVCRIEKHIHMSYHVRVWHLRVCTAKHTRHVSIVDIKTRIDAVKTLKWSKQGRRVERQQQTTRNSRERSRAQTTWQPDKELVWMMKGWLGDTEKEKCEQVYGWVGPRRSAGSSLETSGGFR